MRGCQRGSRTLVDICTKVTMPLAACIAPISSQYAKKEKKRTRIGNLCHICIYTGHTLAHVTIMLIPHRYYSHEYYNMLADTLPLLDITPSTTNDYQTSLSLLDITPSTTYKYQTLALLDITPPTIRMNITTCQRTPYLCSMDVAITSTATRRRASS